MCCGLAVVALVLSQSACRRQQKQKVEPNPEQQRAAFIRSQVPDLPKVVPSSGCGYAPGDLPQKTLQPNSPLGDAIPIDHFVFIVQENRSFDHYFQDFTAAPGTTVDVAPVDYVAQNPDHRRRPFKPYELLHPCPEDPHHDYESVLLAWRGGKMDGFALATNAEAVSYFSHDVLVYYHALARAFALSDRHFADFLGPTWPNRLYMLSATSFGHVNNTSPPADDVKASLFRQLDAKRLAWHVYADNTVFEQGMYPRLHQEHPHDFQSMKQFYADLRSDNLPALAWVESSYGGANATDEHPPANIEIGQQWVSEVIAAVMQSPAWQRTLIILTYDEHGGFYDHVPPPAACVPDEHRPKVKPGHLQPRFDHYGMRVPLIMISPWAKRGYVSHVPTSHASLLRLVQARFGLPALTRRDANAIPPYDMFDFASPPRLAVPALPEIQVEPSRKQNCEARDAARVLGTEPPILDSRPH